MSQGRKRVVYKRSNTLATLPFQPVIESPTATATSTAPPQSLEEASKTTALETNNSKTERKPIPVTQERSFPEARQLHRHSNESIKIPAKWIQKTGVKPQFTVGNALKACGSSEKGSSKVRPKSLTRKISFTDFHQSSLLNAKKSSWSSSNLLARVREKIVETVYQTQDMPHMAAIVQERRLKAAQECEVKLVESLNKYNSLNTNNITEFDVRNHKKYSSLHSNTVAEAVKNQQKVTSCPLKKNGSCETPRSRKRQGFRRRSISQDSYPLISQTILPDARPLLSNVSSDGITCSSSDFQAILNDLNNYKKQYHKPSDSSPFSPTSSKKESSLKIKFMKKNSDKGSSSESNKTSLSTKLFPGKESFRPAQDKQLSFHSQAGDGGLSRIVEIETQKPLKNADESSLDFPNFQGNPGDQNSVCYDENGQTWGVYGAEIDPDILGTAIQMHLERLIREDAENQEEETTPSGSPSENEINIIEEPKNKTIIRNPINSRLNKFCMASKLVTFLNSKICGKDHK